MEAAERSGGQAWSAASESTLKKWSKWAHGMFKVRQSPGWSSGNQMDAGNSSGTSQPTYTSGCSAGIVARARCAAALPPLPNSRLTPSCRHLSIAPARPQKDRPLGSEPWFNPEGVTAAKVRRAAAGGDHPKACASWQRVCGVCRKHHVVSPEGVSGRLVSLLRPCRVPVKMQSARSQIAVAVAAPRIPPSLSAARVAGGAAGARQQQPRAVAQQHL